MSFRAKIRGFLSVFIICLSTVIFTFFCMESSAQAKPVSSGQVAVAENGQAASTAGRPEQTQSPTPKPTMEWSLVLVNENNPMPSDYSFAPALYSGETVDNRIYSQMVELLNKAADQGLSLWVASSYRDKKTQEKILENAVNNRMNDQGMTKEQAMQDALKTIAKPGYSEHQTGLAIDFNYVNADFEQTPEYEWLKKNAQGFGFVQRYPRDKEEITGISAEPWHYRFVGVTHAAAMNENNLCLEEYISYLNNR